MDRRIVYPGQIPQDLDVLYTNLQAMIGMGYMAQDFLGGTGNYVFGLACTPTGPASMQVQIAPGRIYSYQNVDNTAYGSAGVNTSQQILKQGILTSIFTTASGAMTAPVTSGQSINYLIEVGYQDSDITPTVLQYYNSANPNVALSGPGGNGQTQPVTRSGIVVVNVKAGTASTTGTQNTPTVDTGYVGLWVITIAQGQTSITSGNIAAYNAIPANGPTPNIFNRITVNSNGAVVMAGSGGSGTSTLVLTSTNGTTPALQSTGEMVLISLPTTANAANMYVQNGSPFQVAISTSSIRYKFDVRDLPEEAADVIGKLKPVVYKSKGRYDDPKVDHLGLIAEQVHDVDPRLVHYRDGEPDGIQYDRLTVLLLKAVQELTAEVSALRAK